MYGRVLTFLQAGEDVAHVGEAVGVDGGVWGRLDALAERLAPGMFVGIVACAL